MKKMMSNILSYSNTEFSASFKGAFKNNLVYDFVAEKIGYEGIPKAMSNHFSVSIKGILDNGKTIATTPVKLVCDGVTRAYEVACINTNEWCAKFNATCFNSEHFQLLHWANMPEGQCLAPDFSCSDVPSKWSFSFVNQLGSHVMSPLNSLLLTPFYYPLTTTLVLSGVLVGGYCVYQYSQSPKAEKKSVQSESEIVQSTSVQLGETSPEKSKRTNPPLAYVSKDTPERKVISRSRRSLTPNFLRKNESMGKLKRWKSLDRIRYGIAATEEAVNRIKEGARLTLDGVRSIKHAPQTLSKLKVK